MKKYIHKNKIYVLTIAIASMAFGAAHGMPLLQDSQTKLIESIRSLPSDSIEHAQLRERLHRLVEAELKQRFENQEAELNQIELRLEEAKAKLDQRRNKQNEIVDRRIADLLLKRDDLDWASSTASQNELIIDSKEKSSPALPDMVKQIHEVAAKMSPPNLAKPINSDAKVADGMASADAEPVASSQIGGPSISAAESGQVIAVMNEALELEATLDTRLDDDSLSLSHPKIKAAAAALLKQVRFLELKLDVLQVNQEQINLRLGAELSLRQSMADVAGQELEISKELVKHAAEGILEKQRKELDFKVAKLRVNLATIESTSYNLQMDNLAKRVQIVRKKYDEKFVAKPNKPIETNPIVK